jgi:AraC-like DNA-binding protein
MDLTRDEDLSIHAAEALPPGAYGLVDFLFAHAPTLGAGLERAARYFTLIHTGVRLAVIEGPDECVLDVGRNSDPVAVRPDGEFSLAVFVSRLRQSVAGGSLSLVRIECAYPEPRDRRELDRFFACPLKFDCRSNRLVLSPQDWARAPLKSEPGLFRVLDDHARRLEAELPALTSLTAQVRMLIAQELKGGRPLAAHVSKRLGMSERSLQRRLKEEGESFFKLLDELRAQHAAVYLKHQQLSQAEVAHLLGFADVSAFHRAHRRWTGRPPGEA